MTGCRPRWSLGLPRATIDQAAAADTVVVLAGDLREELPVLFLRLRRPSWTGAWTWSSSRPRATSLTRYASASLRYRPGRGHRPGPGPRRPGRSGAARASTPTPWSGPGGWPRRGTWWSSSAGPRWPRTGPWWPRPPRRWPRPSRAPGSCRPSAGATCTAPSTWGWPRACCPAGSPSTAGRDWFAQAWGSVPGQRGRDTAGILAAAAGEAAEGRPLGSLVLLGADPLGDFPDRRLAQRALDGAGFVVAVASTPGPVTDAADVVLPAAEAHERPGTTTNLEGRISRLGQKLVPPGPGLARLDDRRRAGRPPRTPTWGSTRSATCGTRSSGWPRRTGASPGPSSTRRDRRRRGGPAVGPGRGHRPQGGRWPRSTPSPCPGVESVERQGAPPRAGLAESPSAGLGTVRTAESAPTPTATGASRPAAGRASRPRRAPRRPERQLLAAPGGRPRPLRPRGGGGLRCRRWPAWSAPPRCGPTRTTSTSSGWPPGARSGSARPSARPS